MSDATSGSVTVSGTVENIPDAQFKVGQECIWTGLSGLFQWQVRIVSVRLSYLVIFGESPADGEIVYDIADPIVKGAIFGVPADQLAACDTITKAAQ